jgi:hypothetical protein
MSTVWVTQETNHDFQPAEKFGEVRFVTHGDFTNNPNSRINDDLTRVVRSAAGRVKDEDWIVIAGSPYVAALFMAELGNLRYDLRLLRWDNRDFVYRPLILNLR